MYSRKKGKSGSKKPLKDADTKWVKYKPKEIEQLVVKLSKGGNGQAKIGLILRDSYGIPSVKKLTKKSVLQILKEKKLSSEIPEDLANLIKREILITTHIENNNKHDQPSIRGLTLTSSKIRKLIRHYITKGVLPKGWKYSKEQAKLLVG